MEKFDSTRQKNALLQLAILANLAHIAAKEKKEGVNFDAERRKKYTLKFDVEKALDFLARYNLDATGDSDIMLVSYDSINLIPVVKWQALVKLAYKAGFKLIVPHIIYDCDTAFIVNSRAGDSPLELKRMAFPPKTAKKVGVAVEAILPSGYGIAVTVSEKMILAAKALSKNARNWEAFEEQYWIKTAMKRFFLSAPIHEAREIADLISDDNQKGYDLEKEPETQTQAQIPDDFWEFEKEITEENLTEIFGTAKKRAISGGYFDSVKENLIKKFNERKNK